MTSAQAIAAKQRGVILGPPRKFTAVQKQEIAQDLAQYIDDTKDPTIVRFISTYHKHDINKSWFNENLPELVKLAIAKQEAFLLEMYDKPTMAIFRLKQPQHGYTDKQEVQTTSVNVNVDMTGSKELMQGFTEYLKGLNSGK